jgi:hypothetical protein
MHSHLFLGWITILALTSGLQAGNPQYTEALLSTDPVKLEIVAGQVGTLQILLSNANNIYGIDFQATFDPAVVQVVDADSGLKGVQMAPGAFLKPDFMVRNLADNKTGTLRYVVTQLTPTPPVSGKGIILSVQFRGKTPGTSSKLTILSAVVADRHGVKQPVTTRGADLVIIAPKPSTPTPLPNPTLIPAEPTWAAATITLPGSQPTARASATATRNNPTAQPVATALKINPQGRPSMNAQDDPARETGRNPVVSDWVLTYVSSGVLCGAILLFGLLIWLLAAKRRKDKTAKLK